MRLCVRHTICHVAAGVPARRQLRRRRPLQATLCARSCSTFRMRVLRLKSRCLSPMSTTSPPMISGLICREGRGGGRVNSCEAERRSLVALSAARARTFVFRFSVCPLDNSFSSAALALASSSAVRGCGGGGSAVAGREREALLQQPRSQQPPRRRTGRAAASPAPPARTQALQPASSSEARVPH